MDVVAEYIRDSPSYCIHLKVVTYATFLYGMQDTKEVKRIEKCLDQTKRGFDFSPMKFAQARDLCRAWVSDVVCVFFFILDWETNTF